MGLSIQLVDTTLTAAMNREAKHRRKAGRSAVSDIVSFLLEDGELEAALAAVGREALPTLARVDPYGDSEFDHYFCELALTELDRIAERPAPAGQRDFLDELRALFQRAIAEPTYIVRFIGD
ncbi:hypothetical protein [Kitasatospora aureofaciens]|uniref:hypothetical protein n=1 Tax=Kitasatospora aureofaciens TaxID=1894 RepID=UPI000526D86A|nr:hypothetical protein [Kitasatospora aureofaciens]